MATVAQFDFLVRASTDLAVQKLNQLGKAAAAAAGEVEGVENVDLAGWGSSALNAATRAGSGMLSLAKSASAVVEQANFVDQVFKDAAPGIKKWAETADRTALLSESAALKAAAYLGVFGQAIDLTGDDLANFSIRLVDLAADLASVADTSVDDAVTAIGAALRNEYEPMRKYGIVLNDAVLKKTLFDITGQKVVGTLTQEQKILAVNETLFQKLGFAIGDVERTFGGFANQSRYLDAQMENFKAQIGEGLRPAFISLFSAANNVLGVLSGMPPVVIETGSKLALAATGVLGLAGSMAVMVAHAPRYIAALGKMSTGMKDLAAGTTKFGTAGKAFAGITGAAAGITAAVFAIDLFSTAMNAAEDATGRMNTALVRIGKANVTRDADAMANAFGNLIRAEKGIKRLSDVWEQAGTSIRFAGSKVAATVEDTDRAFNKMLETDPNAAVFLLKVLRERNEALDHGSSQYKNNAERIDAYTKKIQESVAASQIQGDVTKFTTEVLAEFGDEELAAAAKADLATEAAEEHAKAVEAMSAKYADARGKLEEINREFADGKVRAEAFGDALQESMGTNAFEENIIDMRDATAGLIDAFKDDDGNLQGLLMGFDSMNDSGRENLGNIEALADAVGNDLMRAFQESGGSLSVVIDRQKDLQTEFENTAAAAGIPADKIKELTDKIFATPDELRIDVEIAGQALAKSKLDTLNLDLDMLPPEKRVDFVAAIEAGDFQTAWQIAQDTINAEGDLNADLAVSPNPLGPVLRDMQTQVNENPLLQMFVVEPPTRDAAQTAWDKMQSNMFGLGPIKTEAEADPQSTAKARGWLQEDLKRPGSLKIDAESTPKSTAQTRGWLQTDLNNQGPITSTANAVPGDSSAARSSLQRENNAWPIGVRTNATPGDTTGARDNMQWWYSRNPLTVEVKPTISPAFRAFQAPYNPWGRSVPSDSRAAAPAARGSVYVPPPVVAGQQAAQMTPSVVNIHMIMPVGADETRIVSALKRYTNNYGALPLKIAQMQVA